MKIILILLIGITLNAGWFDYDQGVMKLKSDSEIYKQNGKLKANSPIYGIFKSNHFLHDILKTNGIYNIDCNLKKHRYNVVDDCRLIISKDDTSYMSKLNPNTSNVIYLEKMEAMHIKQFNYKTYEIECLYDQDYGIMQDCKRKIFKYEFR